MCLALVLDHNVTPTSYSFTRGFMCGFKFSIWKMCVQRELLKQLLHLHHLYHNSVY